MTRRKDNSAKELYYRKVGDEDRVKNQKEKEVMQLEMLEMELIKKLQNTQAIQKAAYSELENALAKPSAILGSSMKKNQMLVGGNPGKTT